MKVEESHLIRESTQSDSKCKPQEEEKLWGRWHQDRGYKTVIFRPFVRLSAVLTFTSDIWSKTNFLRLLPANNYCQVWDYEKLTVRHFPSVNKTPWPIKWVSEPETGSAVLSWLSWWLNVVIRDCCDQPRKWLPPNEHLNGKLVE